VRLRGVSKKSGGETRAEMVVLTDTPNVGELKKSQKERTMEWGGQRAACNLSPRSSKSLPFYREKPKGGWATSLVNLKTGGTPQKTLHGGDTEATTGSRKRTMRLKKRGQREGKIKNSRGRSK